MVKHLKKLIIVSMIVAIFLSLTACTKANNKSGKNDTNSQNVSENQKKDEPKVAQDTKKTEQLKKEKEVFDGQVYTLKNKAIANIVIKDNVSESDAKALAERYAKELKEKYKNMQVNVQAVQKGKSVANITL